MPTAIGHDIPECRLCGITEGDGASLSVTSSKKTSRGATKFARRSVPPVGLFLLLFLFLFAVHTDFAAGSAYDFLRVTGSKTLFAISPDIMLRTINPKFPDRTWTLGEGWGIPPFFHHSRVGGMYDRVDFLYPFGIREESTFQSRLKFFPFFESRWAKIPPYDGFSRCLTLYQGRSDLGQEYWGVFPLYGYMYRRHGVDKNSFFLFPLYYESTVDDARTRRFLWPIITYADSPGRQAFKVWPLFGADTVKNEYQTFYLAWPFFQVTDRHMGTEQASSYRALPFPLYVRQDTNYSTTTELLWPLITYYHHYASGFKRYSVRPLFSYGSGGGIEEFSLLYLYSYKKDRNKGTTTGSNSGYISVDGDDVFTERSFLMVSKIQKRYRKGGLVFAMYRFWPFAEYVWDIEKGSHLKFPEIIPLRNDWWDINLGRLLRFVDFRETPITRELSLLFGLSNKTEIKPQAGIPRPPRPGDDNWTELITGSFGKR
ncbi:MAG TPA: hypothetical protein VK463_02395 [Desulfomonilaceae bacterium]|nr:hypothetical protein [Desulfomonilaceae bacterium]